MTHSSFFPSNPQPGVWLAITAAGIFVAGTTTAQAQSPAPSTTPDRPLAFRSALVGYQPHTDEKIVNWKEANDTTRRIGGWREYARQVQEQPAELSKTDDASATPVKNPHAGHGKP